MKLNQKILCIDDDENFLLTLESLLNESFEIQTANSISSAHEQIAQNNYDAIVLDHILEDGNGYQLLEKTRTKLVSPVLVLTGNPSRSMLERYRSFQSVKKVLIKPIDIQELEVQILHSVSNLKWNSIQSLLKNLHHTSLRTDLYEMILHDISNMLTVMIGSVQLLNSRTEDQSKRVKDIESAVHRMIRLTMYARRINVISEDKIYNFNLIECINELTEVYSDMLSPRIKIFISFSSSFIPVRISRLLLEIVLNNLLQNAKQAMDEGTIFIEVVQDHNYIKIIFRDTGHGIDESIQSKLFEQSVTTKENGMGIGLYVSKKLVNDIGGDITLHKTSENGTTFVVSIPDDIKLNQSINICAS